MANALVVLFEAVVETRRRIYVASRKTKFILGHDGLEALAGYSRMPSRQLHVWTRLGIGLEIDIGKLLSWK